jgi:hypothetical protein
MALLKTRGINNVYLADHQVVLLLQLLLDCVLRQPELIPAARFDNQLHYAV